MVMNIRNKTVIIYTLIGIGIGIMFPVGATIIEMYASNIKINYEDVVILHESNMLLMVIDTAPIFLGIFAFIAGMNQHKSEENNRKLDKTLNNEIEVKKKLGLVIEEIEKINDSISKVSATLLEVFNYSKSNIEGIDGNLGKILFATENTTSDINEFHSCINSFVNSIENIETSTDNANKISNALSKLALDGERYVNNSIEDMFNINDFARKVSETVNQLDIKVKEVSKIIYIINDIYDKTNLLALNAAIEAAKAGEYAGGFSVVADQIRVLAQQSKERVDEIKNLISAMSEGSKKSVFFTQNIVEMINSETQNTNSTKNVFKDIFEKIDKIDSIVNKLNHELKNQVKDSDYILGSLDNIIAASQQTSTLCQDSVAISEDNKSEIEKLASSVQSLTMLSNKLNLIFK